MRDPTTRFTDRVSSYVASRPGYPASAIDWLSAELGLGPDVRVLDLGSGTGLLSRRFLERGHAVLGVEPNDAMRAAGEQALAGFERFSSVAARAEASGLPECAADVAVAGQAFHWFHVEQTRLELQRVLTGAAPVALVWNDRQTEGSAFLSAYETFVHTWATETDAVASRTDLAERVAAFFTGGFRQASFANAQDHDRSGFRLRVLSASYMPGPESARHGPMLDAVDGLFDDHAVGGRVTFDYETIVFAGRLRR